MQSVRSKILVLSAHTDDAEIGVGGTIARLCEEGSIVKVIAFSRGHPSRGTRVGEFSGAVDRLGATSELVHGFYTRLFFHERAKILDTLMEIKERECPDVVFVPTSVDVHQDHQVIAHESLRAFKHCTLLGYEIPGNVVREPPRLSYFVELKPCHVEEKVVALACYESQIGLVKMQVPSMIWALARLRGLQAGVDLAEAFEVSRVMRRLA